MALPLIISSDDDDNATKIELLQRHGVAAYELCEDNMAVVSLAEVLLFTSTRKGCRLSGTHISRRRGT